MRQGLDKYSHRNGTVIKHKKDDFRVPELRFPNFRICDFEPQEYSNGIQSSQLIVATHSEYVLRSALKDKDNVLIIILNDDNGLITPKTVNVPGVLPTITAAETNYLAFNIASIDYHIELYGYLQMKERKPYIKDCDDFIFNHPLFDSAKYGKASSYGRAQYNTLPTYIRNAIDHPDSGNRFTDDELRRSIEFLIQLL